MRNFVKKEVLSCVLRFKMRELVQHTIRHRLPSLLKREFGDSTKIEGFRCDGCSRTENAQKSSKGSSFITLIIFPLFCFNIKRRGGGDFNARMGIISDKT